MIRYWIMLPVLAVTALTGSALWWESEKGWWIPPIPKVPDIQSVDPVPLITTVTPMAALDRPLLWSSRRVRKVQPAQDTRLSDELSQARLISVVQSGTKIVVLLRRKDGALAKYSQDTQPWRVEAFDGRTATFVAADGQRMGLPLEAASRGR